MNSDAIRELLGRRPFEVDPEAEGIANCALLHVASLSLIHPVSA